jgi:hypothetical protein
MHLRTNRWEEGDSERGVRTKAERGDRSKYLQVDSRAPIRWHNVGVRDIPKTGLHVFLLIQIGERGDCGPGLALGVHPVVGSSPACCACGRIHLFEGPSGSPQTQVPEGAGAKTVGATLHDIFWYIHNRQFVSRKSDISLSRVLLPRIHFFSRKFDLSTRTICKGYKQRPHSKWMDRIVLLIGNMF